MLGTKDLKEPSVSFADEMTTRAAEDIHVKWGKAERNQLKGLDCHLLQKGLQPSLGILVLR